LNNMAVARAFKNFNKMDLIDIAHKKHFVFQTSKEPLDAVVEEVTSLGMQRLLRCLDKELLEKMTKSKGQEHTKNQLINKALKSMNSDGQTPKKWFNGHDQATLTSVASQVEMDDPKNVDVPRILAQAEEFGLENCFSAFDSSVLQGYAQRSGLKVESTSANVLIDCLIHTKDFKSSSEPKKEKKEPEQRARPNPQSTKTLPWLT